MVNCPVSPEIVAPLTKVVPIIFTPVTFVDFTFLPVIVVPVILVAVARRIAAAGAVIVFAAPALVS